MSGTEGWEGSVLLTGAQEALLVMKTQSCGGLFFLLAPAVVLLSSRVSGSTSACTPVLFFPSHPLSLRVSQNKLLLCDGAIEREWALRRHREDFIWERTDSHKLSVCSFLSKAVRFLHPRLTADGWLIFSISFLLACVLLFIPELQPLVMAHSVPLASCPADFGQGCSLEI